MENNKKYILGLDLGVASIGWAVMEINEEGEPIKLLDANSVIFPIGDSDEEKKENRPNSIRRLKRGSRRVSRRKKYRLNKIKRLIVNNELLSKNDLDNIFYNGESLKDIYKIREEGLNKELTREELSRLLIFYAKNREFKSNRKNDLGLFKESNEDDKKLKKSIKESIKQINDEKISPIEYILKKRKKLIEDFKLTNPKIIEEFEKNINNKFKEKTKDLYDKFIGYKNKNGEFYFAFTREDIKKEIERILKNQSYITDKFKEDYLNIWGSQRDFSDGPGGDSPYKVDYIKLAGLCKYEKNKRRAVKACYSSELFILLQKLTDIRYYDNLEDSLNKKNIQRLTSEEIKKIVDIFIKKSEKFTYNFIKEVLNKKEIIFNNLPELNIDVWKKLKKDNIDLNGEEFSKLVYKNRCDEKVLNSPMSNTRKMINELKQNGVSFKEKEILEVYKFLDCIGEILTYAKTDNKIDFYIDEYKKTLAKEGKIDNGELDYSILKKEENKKIREALYNMSGYSGNIKLSLKAIRKLNEKMLEGKDYYEARSECGYFVYLDDVNWTKFPSIQEIEKGLRTELTNLNVNKTISVLKKVYDKINEKFGKPEKIHIELAREMNKTKKERDNIKKAQLERYENNEKYRFEIYKKNKDVFGNKKYVSREDLIRFKLWEEQEGKCIYSDKIINKNDVLSYKIEVDHILPYSKTHNNSELNKVLVYKEENQNKKDNTPFEWIGNNKEKWELFKKRVNDSKLPSIKKQNLLRNDPINFKEGFTESEIQTTSYASRLSYAIFRRMFDPSDKYLFDENGVLKEEPYNDRVIAFNGMMTSQLRKFYDLNKLTHNLESENMIRKSEINKLEGIRKLITKKNEQIKVEYSFLISKGEAVEKNEEKIEIKYNAKKGYKNELDEKVYNFIKRLDDDIIFCEIFESKIKDMIDFYEISEDKSSLEKIFKDKNFELNLDVIEYIFKKFIKDKKAIKIKSIFKEVKDKNANLIITYDEFFEMKKNIFTYDIKNNKFEEKYKFIKKLIENKKFNNFVNNNISNVNPLNISEKEKFEIFEKINTKYNDDCDINDQLSADVIYEMINDFIFEIKKDINSKNRSNHLHHALDAVLLTVMTKSMQQKLTRYNQLLFFKENKSENLVKEFLEQLEKESIIYESDRGVSIKIGNDKKIISMVYPYKEFVNDIKKIIFNKTDENSKMPYFVSRNKEQGQLHEETYYGIKKGCLVKRVKLDKKIDVELIFDKDKSQKEIYETIKKWKNDKSEMKYPILKNGNIIKKVKIIEKYPYLKLKKGVNVMPGKSIVKIMLYKKINENGENILCFTKIVRIINEKIKQIKKLEKEKMYLTSENDLLYVSNKINKLKKEVNIKIYEGNKENIINYYDVFKFGYKKYLEIIPGGTYKIIKKTEKRICENVEEIDSYIDENIKKSEGTICIITGFSDGEIPRLKIKSVLGDDLDIINMPKDKNVAVTTIDDIIEIKSDILGD